MPFILDPIIFEKEQLLADMEDTINQVEEKNKEKLTDIQIEIEEIKTKL